MVLLVVASLVFWFRIWLGSDFFSLLLITMVCKGCDEIRKCSILVIEGHLS